MRRSFCPEFKYECPIKWDDLQATDEAGVRFCGKCQERVYECRSPRAFLEYVKQQHCVSFVYEQTPGGSLRTMGIAKMPRSKAANDDLFDGLWPAPDPAAGGSSEETGK